MAISPLIVESLQQARASITPQDLLLRGWSISAVARECKLPVETILDISIRVYEDYHKRIVSCKRVLVAAELLRLNGIDEQISEMEKEEVKSSNVLKMLDLKIKLSERRSKLLGLDELQKTLYTEGGDDESKELRVSELRAEILKEVARRKPSSEAPLIDSEFVEIIHDSTNSDGPVDQPPRAEPG